MHLADKYPQKHLAPEVGTIDRAHYYRWMVYVPATVDPTLEIITFHGRFLPEEKRIPRLVEEAKKKWEGIARVLEEAVDGRDFVVGKSFTAADVAVASAIGWVGFLGMLEAHPKLAAYHAKMAERPAYKRAHAD
ncbi:MAG TPA: glutathione binding-like protein [Minicystis sp.]|nr:glutathione binding-like protein [Minicystis sp.]